MELSESSFPGFAEAMLRFYTAYKEEQFALADQRQVAIGRGSDEGSVLVADVRRFLAARRNCFPGLDAAPEKLAGAVDTLGGLPSYFMQRHTLRVRRIPVEIMSGSTGTGAKYCSTIAWTRQARISSSRSNSPTSNSMRRFAN